MIVIKQKISSCFRANTGVKQFCFSRGYISTLRKQKLNILEGLTITLSSTLLLPALCSDLSVMP